MSHTKRPCAECGVNEVVWDDNDLCPECDEKDTNQTQCEGLGIPEFGPID